MDEITAQAPTTLVVPHARHEGHWHRYVNQAVPLGLRSQLAVRLGVGERPIGGLNPYSTTHDTVSDDTVQLAELFAIHAAHAVHRARGEDNFTAAIGTWQLIGQATGIVMAAFDLDAERAFQFLVRVAPPARPRSEIAEQIVAKRSAR